MKEELISIETAKLSKEKGFDLELPQYNYSEENNYEIGFNVYTLEDLKKYKIYPAPTQSLLQRWLREEHKLILTIGYVYEHDSTPYTFFIYNEGHSSPINAWKHDYSTYEEALEEGLKTALNEIQ